MASLNIIPCQELVGIIICTLSFSSFCPCLQLSVKPNMKQCPYCRADSFGVRELFALDYYHTNECKECGKPVRNDGLRQFLVIPAIIAAVPVGFLIFALVPEVFDPFALLLFCLLVCAPAVLLAKPVKAEYDAGWSQFDADPANDKAVLVSGWNEEELRQILDGFGAENPSGFPPYRVELHKEHETGFRLTFPEDIHPSLFTALVNYLMYPIELGTADRPLVVAGQTTLGSEFDGIPKGYLGQTAVLYVPENDEDYDVVCMQTETGINFANSLNGN